MSALVALKLILQGQREVAAGVGDVTKQTSALGVAADKTTVGLKKMSGGLDSIAKSGVGVSAAAEKASTAVVAAEKKVQDALRASALAAKQAADAKIRAATLAADAVAKQAAGDLKAAEASKIAAKAATEQAGAYTKMAAAMRSQASAARASLASVRGGGGPATGGGMYAGLARGGGLLAKAGAFGGAFLGYEGVKRASGLVSQTNQLTTLANVPAAEAAALQRWALSNSVGLRASPVQLEQEMYRIASAAPGKRYSAGLIERLTGGAQRLAYVGGPTVSYDQSARLFGIVRANGFRVGANRIGALARATIGSGDMTAQDLITAIGTGGLLPNAARHKMSLLSTFGVLAELGDLGINGSRAGNAVQRSISLLSSPNSAASKVYASLGLQPTAIDQIIRSKGLLAGLGVLQSQLRTKAATALPGMTGNASEFTALGFTRSQAAKMAGQGQQSLEDLLLTRMFGGAKQSVPIIALLNGLNRTGSKTSEIARTSGPGSLQKAFGLTANTPAGTFKRFDQDLQNLETNIGLKVIPKLMDLGNWISRNEALVVGIGHALEIIAIPALAAWATSLATKGVKGLQGFSGGLRETTGGLGVMQKGVMGLTAAVGIWELGSHTSQSGAGALQAGLGGAIAGMTAGLAVGGPWGAAIGGAGGALVGLAGHFFGAASGANAATRAAAAYDATIRGLTGDLRSAMNADKGFTGAQTNAQLTSWMQTHPGTLNELRKYGIQAPELLAWVRSGFAAPKPFSPFYQILQDANSPKFIHDPQLRAAMRAISILEQSYIGARRAERSFLEFTQHHEPSPPVHHHHHLYIDGKEVTTHVKHHLANDYASVTP